MTEQSDWKSAVERERRQERFYQFGMIAMIAVAVIGTGAYLTLKGVAWTAPVADAAPEVMEVNAFADVKLSAKSAIVYDLATGMRLYGKDPEAQLPLASLTKLLTVYAALTSLPENAFVTVSADALAVEGDSGFAVGDTFWFDDIARLALVASSNDAAAAIAEAAERSGTLSRSLLLAGAAESIGLSQTYAMNGTGLDETLSVSGAYGSAADVAILAGALAARAPEITKATEELQISATTREGKTVTLKNTNPNAIHVPGLLLSKTGFTDLAGGNLAVVFDAGVNHPVAVVVLGSTREERFTDVKQLIDATLEHFASL